MSSEHIETNIKIVADAVVCTDCDLQGDIFIGGSTVIHPKATIIAEAGPIVIGEGNIIEEQSTIINKLLPGAKRSETNVMTIGNFNVFEIGCHSEALKIGDHNTLEAKSFVGRNVELTKCCVIGAGCRISNPEIIPENLVVFGSMNSRRKQSDKPQSQTLQIDYLSKVMPNYHHLKRANVKK